MATRVEEASGIEDPDKEGRQAALIATAAEKAVNQAMPNRPRLIIVCSTRGGVGKTTFIAVLLSCAQASGRLVYAIDADVKREHITYDAEGYAELTKARQNTLFYGYCKSHLPAEQIAFEVLDVGEAELRDNPHVVSQAFDGLVQNMIGATENPEASCFVDTPAGGLIPLLDFLIDTRPWESGIPIPWLLFPITADGGSMAEGVAAFKKVAELRAALPADRRNELRIVVVANRFALLGADLSNYEGVASSESGLAFFAFEEANQDWVFRFNCKEALYTLFVACAQASIDPLLAIRLHAQGKLMPALRERLGDGAPPQARVDAEIGNLRAWLAYFAEGAENVGLVALPEEVKMALKPTGQAGGPLLIDRSKFRRFGR